MSDLDRLKNLVTQLTGGGDRIERRADLHLVAASAPTASVHSRCESTFAIVLQGAKQVWLGERGFVAQAGDALLFPAKLPLRSRVVQASAEQPFLAIGLTLNPEVALAMLDRCRTIPGAPIALQPMPAQDTLIEPLIRLLQLWHDPDDMAVLRPLIEAELAWRLASGGLGGLLREIFQADGATPGISRVLELLHDQPGRALSVEELAAVAAMSVTSFHRHFRDLTGASPVQYRKQLRLEYARARVLLEQHDIAAISLSAGYASPSQFSRDYRRAFGRPPSADAGARRVA